MSLKQGPTAVSCDGDVRFMALGVTLLIATCSESSIGVVNTCR
jgi:hypothetical protein